MGKLVLMVDADRHELGKTDFASHSGTIYYKKHRSRDGGYWYLEIWAESPTPANFNSMDDGTVVPNKSKLHDTADSGLTYIKKSATAWEEMGEVT